VLISSTIKYALGRNTFVVNSAIAYAKECLPIMRSGMIDAMIKEIEQFGKPDINSYGDKVFQSAWLSLLVAMKKFRKTQQFDDEGNPIRRLASRKKKNVEE
jgi:hypothetical protein